ncbi:MAG: acetate--CoA ligase family protein [Candidatus Bathyarchaeota archaeon]|nr:acetate--CoA ligase family protein [Candidatus Bathyarchaeota archaeon]
MEQIVEQMHVFFEPQSVAVVGASRRIMKAGHVIFKNFVDNKRRGIFKGQLYPINLREKTILGYKSYSSIAEIDGEIELVVIVVPAKVVPKVMKESAEKGTKAAVIISAGFSEVGNHDLEEQVKTIARKAGIRVLGPNCLGVYDSQTGVDMLFLPETKILTTGDEVVGTPRPMSGQIAIVTQSGAFGAAALDYLAGKQLGISKFVSFGNKCDVDESEMFHYLLQDKRTRVILFYAESIDSGRNFMEVAKGVTQRKPVVALKSGRTKSGARAAESHTGAIAGSDEIYDSVFRQVGILRARDMEEFFDMSKALAFQPPATGKNVAVITDAGGPGIMAVDECVAGGLNVKNLSDETIQKFEELKREGKIPSFATNLNPVDLTGSATSKMFEYGTKVLLEDSEIHGVIVLGLHHLPALQEDFVDLVANLSKKYTKPVVACDIGETETALRIRSRFDKLGIPAYFSPEDAARAMVALVNYGLYLKKNGRFEQYLETFFKNLQRKI